MPVRWTAPNRPNRPEAATHSYRIVATAIGSRRVKRAWIRPFASRAEARYTWALALMFSCEGGWLQDGECMRVIRVPVPFRDVRTVAP